MDADIKAIEAQARGALGMLRYGVSQGIDGDLVAAMLTQAANVEDAILNPTVETPTGGRVMAITAAVRRCRARNPTVVLLTRATRTLASLLAGNPHRGLIPGGEDEAAWLSAVERGERDPAPVWL